MYLSKKNENVKNLSEKKTLFNKAIGLVSRVKYAIGSYFQHDERLTLHNINNVMDIKPEYNTPYMYYKMIRGAHPGKQENYIFWVPPSPVNEFYGKAIIFYEEFDGTRWKLSKPEHWITEKR